MKNVITPVRTVNQNFVPVLDIKNKKKIDVF